MSFRDGPHWPHEAYCAAAEAEIAAYAAALADAPPGVDVPSCPGWTAAELTRHLGGVHRWARGLVATRAQEAAGRREMGVTWPDDDADLGPWFAEGGRDLLTALRDAGPDEPVWTWGDGGTAGWWARRMLHETAVHRCDLDLALGRAARVPAGVAVDGVGELLANLRAAAAFSPNVKELRGAGTLTFAAADAGARWNVRFTADGFTAERADGPAPADATASVTGAAADLYLFAWGRRAPGDPALAFTGDAALVALFAGNAAVQ
ncbi:maleylpyruvate isomerase family mycothiol-dependent enzyme [Actinomadura rayongensis]|uniref:Maleylpyruvate isomerase family mycothiol-dependent enzyme n=1 Tax=Actinomadura rayongensis TaxID=1429076 RepID=A0A6I4W9Y8_9ACTN|nr:maleylpyruvate isomerase family mycothiol-dependent enzyme [Actinomadura rayongensis]